MNSVSNQISPLRRTWCVRLALALIVLGAVSNLFFLFNHCPLDLVEDETHYWEWSRHLDYGYYSKPPGIAWVIRGAVELAHLFGVADNGVAMAPWIRLPAVIFGLCSGLLTLALARRIFKDDRAGLAVIVVGAAVPMFAVGSLLITIDSPMYLCWAATVYCLWRHVEASGQSSPPQVVSDQTGVGEMSSLTTDHRPLTTVRWLYLAGLAASCGMLFKPVLIAIPICVALAAKFSPQMRAAFRTRHTIFAGLLMLLSQAPVVIWNAAHDWVTFRHIATQGVGSESGDQKTNWFVATLRRFGEFIGGQAGPMGGLMFVLLIVAVVVACKRCCVKGSEKESAGSPRWIFLLSFTLPLWTFYFAMNFWKGTEPNWPAASYFTGMILVAGILSEGWNAADAKLRKTWRTWGTITMVWGVVLTAVAFNLHRLYPIAAEKLPAFGSPDYGKSWWNPSKWDQPAIRLRGHAERAVKVDGALTMFELQSDRPTHVFATRYDLASSLAFYLPGQPFVGCVMSRVGGRMSQYDVWADPVMNVGDNVLLVGGMSRPELQKYIEPAFERIDAEYQRLPVVYQGVTIREALVLRCYGFKGKWPAKADETHY